MPNRNHTPPTSTRESRMRYVQLLKVEAEMIDPPGTKYPTPPRPTTQAQRRRIVEILALQAGRPLPQWDRATHRCRAEAIDTSPWETSRAASLGAQQQRFGRFGLAFASDGTIRCVRCKEIVVAIPRNRPFAMGAPASALQARHAQATGCR